MIALGPIFDFGLKLVDKFFTTPEEKQKAQLELLRMQQAGELATMQSDMQIQLAQIDVNKTEASSSSFFVAGWRPAVGWVCVLGLLYMYLVRPLVSIVTPVPAPAIDTSDLLLLLGGLLGFGGLRTFEKLKGVSR
jgi:hypothetical protein